MAEEELFTSIASSDFLGFSFNGRSYSQQLETQSAATGRLCAISCRIRNIAGVDVMWMQHEYGFIGGSLGCAEGEKLVRGFEKAIELGIPAVIVSRSGGARMQEGTLSLMQMAKVSVAVRRFKEATRKPFISVCLDPTFGGTTASYAMQGDVRIGVRTARVGFAGENVILNTVYKMDQAAYDRDCPPGFQTAQMALQHGQLDLLVDTEDQVDVVIGQILSVLILHGGRASRPAMPNGQSPAVPVVSPAPMTSPAPLAPLGEKPEGFVSDYTKARRGDRVQTQDLLSSLFEGFVELSGDGRVGYDRCIRGGLALFERSPVMAIATFKGHDPVSAKDANFGMAEPAGYRTALRLMTLAEHFGIPVVTLVDTPGAYPSFGSEIDGQPEAIATNLLAMAGLTVPIVTIFVGEGGSGGALAVAMGDRIAMLSDAYYGCITPEGAASILCRYKSDVEKAAKFPADCRSIATCQRIYAQDLLELGVIDDIIWENVDEKYDSCTHTLNLSKEFVRRSMEELRRLSASDLVDRRFKKFRRMGRYSADRSPSVPSPSLSPMSAAQQVPAAPKRAAAAAADKTPVDPDTDGIVHYIANQVVNGPHSVLYTQIPSDVIPIVPIKPANPALRDEGREDTAKYILDTRGPAAVVEWLKNRPRVLVTDTSMRDAHQSLLATRVRTYDLLAAAEETSVVLRNAFSLEVWGGATFDVCLQFLHEDPFKRLRLLREKMPNICFQMLVRGANAVGYKSYPDNVIREFIRLAAQNGIDVFRIFDCFNDIEQMRVCIDAAKEFGKLCEVCVCFTGNFLDPNEKTYTLDYYRTVAKQIADCGAHIIGIKDMAGLFRPQMAAPFLAALRSVTDLPVHFHTHNTSSAALTAAIDMARNGCAVIDLAIASMSDTTSQPSLNAFLASMAGQPRDPEINFLTLEKLDLLWNNIRAMYFPYESGLRSGTARVYEHQIPGGQYSNLIAQCKSLGIWHRWGEVLDMYRDVNRLCGDIIKVTPSSKCVGDMALFMINKNLTVLDVMERADKIDWPQSVVNLFKGGLGFPHHGFPAALSEKILKGQKPNVGRPGALLPPADFVAERASLETKHKMQITDEQLITSLLYPKEFDDYVAYTRKFGAELLISLPTFQFLFGMKIGATVEFDHVTTGKHYSLTLQRVGPLSNDNMRSVVWKLGDRTHEFKIKETRASAAGGELAGTIRANPADKTHIPSPLPGVVDRIYIQPGAKVAKGALLMSVAAMKMEVQVVAPYTGTVEKVCVSVGMKVDNHTLLATLKESAPAVAAPAAAAAPVPTAAAAPAAPEAQPIAPKAQVPRAAVLDSAQ